MSQVLVKHTRIAVVDDNDLRTKIIIQKKLPSVKIIERKDVNILKDMNDLNIIMNPPYDSNLHLKVLQNVINEFPDANIVNLSPIRWLEDPCAEYKKGSDFKKFSLVRSHIEKLEKISVIEAENSFGIGLPYNLGLFPWLGDYTHEWTDEMLYKYFDLTEDEIRQIERGYHKLTILEVINE